MERAQEKTERSAAEEIAALLPRGSVVTLVSESEDDAREAARALRKTGISARASAAENACDSDVRMFVAVGGERAANEAKALGAQYALPVFAAIASPAAVQALEPRYTDSEGNAHPCAAPVGAALVPALLENKFADLPAALGGIVSAATHVFDREAYGWAVGKRPPEKVREQALDCVYCALDAATAWRRDDARLPVRLAETAFSLARLSAREGAVLTCGGADDCAAAAARLCRYEDRACRPRGENAFLYGRVLSSLYGVLCDLPQTFLPPPDNNRRAEALSEYFGLSPYAAARIAVSRLPAVELCMYRVREYRDELYALWGDVRRVYEEAWRPFRRLYADDGYSLHSAFDASEVRTVVGLAPDLSKQNTALTLLREFGVLERWLP